MREALGRRLADGAKRIGTAVHVVNGLVFGLVYALVWWVLDPAIQNAWWIGPTFGAVHGLVVMAMMPVMSGMHPRVREGAVAATAPAEEVALPRFGFGGTGFGSITPAGVLVGHLVFGVVWGLVFWWLV